MARELVGAVVAVHIRDPSFVVAPGVDVVDAVPIVVGTQFGAADLIRCCFASSSDGVAVIFRHPHHHHHHLASAAFVAVVVSTLSLHHRQNCKDHPLVVRTLVAY